MAVTRLGHNGMRYERLPSEDQRLDWAVKMTIDSRYELFVGSHPFCWQRVKKMCVLQEDD